MSSTFNAEFCQRYTFRSCDNCGFQCYDESATEACSSWIPSRGGHPSTPNPCECRYSYEFDLCLNECEGCKNICWED